MVKAELSSARVSMAAHEHEMAPTLGMCCLFSFVLIIVVRQHTVDVHMVIVFNSDNCNESRCLTFLTDTN